MKKSIRVSNLTLDLYLDYVRPSAIKTGILEDAVTEEGLPYHVTDEAIAKEIEDDMRFACFNAGYDGVKRTHEEYIIHEAEQMLYQIEVSIKYCKDDKTIEALSALHDAMSANVKIKKVRKEVEKTSARSAWDKGVTSYAVELIEGLEEAVSGGYVDESDLESPKLLERALLNGARDWNEYSWGGCSLIYNGDIANRLCSPSELKKTGNGERKPNRNEEWLDVQARALFQACELVKMAVRSAVVA